ncbi:hypothetical protein FRC10_008418 [Ceratobasidium sp. 414]|nr:hypothetical protein FRC10_008418 [Ceratobasidium sp. 414]
MGAAAHSFATPDFVSFLPSNLEQLLQLPPLSNIPPTFLGETSPKATTVYSFTTSTTLSILEHMSDSASSTSPPHVLSVPTLPTSLLPVPPSNPKVPSDDMAQARAQNTKHIAATTGSPCNLNDSSALGHTFGIAAAHGGVVPPVSSNSRHSPGYTSTLVRRSIRGVCASTAAERSAGHKYRGSAVTRATEEDMSGSDEESEPGRDMLPSNDLFRHEEIRRQRIESEQRRRNDLHGGFAHLKEALPTTHEKCSKLVLLDRAANHLRYLETRLQQVEDKLTAFEQEVTRLRQISEAVVLAQCSLSCSTP